MKFSYFLIPILFCVSEIQSSDWPQWRGPSRDGQVQRTSEFPESLKDNKLVQKWSAPLAEGYSSPVVAAGKVFTFETLDEKWEIARAFDLASGEQVWEQKWEGAMKVPFFAKKNGSWVRSTPATDGKAVYFGGMRDVLAKLDVETGKVLWKVDFPKRDGTELPTFGYVSSPLLDDGSIYVQAGSAVTKLNAETGETIWRAMEDNRAMFGSAFSSPVLATIQGRKQLVAQTRMTLGGIDVATGKLLWSTPVKAFRGMNILTPTVIDNRVLIATYGGGTFLFDVEADANGAFSVSQVWNNEKLEGYMGTPLVVGNHAFLHGRDQRLHCIDLKSGKASWSTDEKFGQYWSLIRKGERMLALDQKGELLLFDASPDKFQLLDRRKVSKESTWAHVGLTGDKILIRGLKSLSAFDWKSGEAETVTSVVAAGE